MIGDVSGDVYDISLTHVYIDEVGGNISSDQISGRNIMIPNHLLFEHNIINYTLTNDYVLGEVAVSITYESNLDKAEKIVKESTIKFIEEYSRITKEPVTRMNMDPSCMNLRILFFAPVRVMQEIKSNITKEIYNQIKKEKDVEIAYPHTEIVFKNKNLFKK
jgi:small-conductance mechanosensitive channel